MILLQLIGVTVVLVLGLKIAMGEDMLLEKLGAYLERKIQEGHKWLDLFYCQWCMSTLQSIVAIFVLMGLEVIPFEWNWELLIWWPLTIAGGSIIAGNFWNVYLTINRIKERNEAEAEYYRRLMTDDESSANGNDEMLIT